MEEEVRIRVENLREGGGRGRGLEIEGEIGDE